MKNTVQGIDGNLYQSYFGAVLNSSRYNGAYHWFTVLAACLAFLPMIAGRQANFGSIYNISRMVGFEHWRRMPAELVGLTTIVALIWTWLIDKRRWIRGLTLAGLSGVVFQAALGRLAVLNLLPPAILIAHAVVGQTIFCVLAAIAVFTSRSWLQEPTQRILRSETRPLLRHCWMLIGLVYLELILGAAFRQVWTQWGPTAANRWPASEIIHLFLDPYIANALLLGGLVLYVSLRVISKHSAIPHLRRPALALLVLLICQLLLGVFAYVTRVVQGMDELQPTAVMGFTTAHMGLGALILAVTAVLTTQAYRYRGEPAQVLPFERHPEVVSA